MAAPSAALRATPWANALFFPIDQSFPAIDEHRAALFTRSASGSEPRGRIFAHYRAKLPVEHILGYDAGPTHLYGLAGRSVQRCVKRRVRRQQRPIPLDGRCRQSRSRCCKPDRSDGCECFSSRFEWLGERLARSTRYGGTRQYVASRCSGGKATRYPGQENIRCDESPGRIESARHRRLFARLLGWGKTSRHRWPWLASHAAVPQSQLGPSQTDCSA